MGSGREPLTTVDDDLSVDGNIALTNVDGFGGLTTVGGDLWVWDNEALCQSYADNLYAQLTNAGFTGTFTSYYNLDGC